MILVDVMVPMLDMTFDFELEETMKTGKLLVQILEVIARTERGVNKPCRELFLYAVGSTLVLNPEKTLEQQGIESGERLIVI